MDREVPSPGMPQFIARVYREKSGFRVVVDSLLHFDVAREEDIEKATKAAILERLRAPYPQMRYPERPYPDSIRELYFDIEIAKVRAKAGPAGGRSPEA